MEVNPGVNLLWGSSSSVLDSIYGLLPERVSSFIDNLDIERLLGEN